jgi:hypothetical protein
MAILSLLYGRNIDVRYRSRNWAKKAETKKSRSVSGKEHQENNKTHLQWRDSVVVGERTRPAAELETQVLSSRTRSAKRAKKKREAYIRHNIYFSFLTPSRLVTHYNWKNTHYRMCLFMQIRSKLLNVTYYCYYRTMCYGIYTFGNIVAPRKKSHRTRTVMMIRRTGGLAVTACWRLQ